MMRINLTLILCNCRKRQSQRFIRNPTFIDVDFTRLEEELNRKYHIFLSYERNKLNTVEAVLRQLVFRLGDEDLFSQQT